MTVTIPVAAPADATDAAGTTTDAAADATTTAGTSISISTSTTDSGGTGPSRRWRRCATRRASPEPTRSWAASAVWRRPALH